MPKRQRADDAASSQSIFPLVQFPSDHLTLGQLRASWPDPKALAEIVRAVRIMEENFALEGALPEGHKMANDPLFKPDWDQDRRDLVDFYVHTGLATGKHAANLLIRSIEEQARKLYAERYR
jgi:hypothetical protein